MPAFRYQHGDRPLDGYTIEHGVGRGGFGEVYYAVSDSGRQVALKAVQNYEEIELRGIRPLHESEESVSRLDLRRQIQRPRRTVRHHGIRFRAVAAAVAGRIARRTGRRPRRPTFCEKLPRG